LPSVFMPATRDGIAGKRKRKGRGEMCQRKPRACPSVADFFVTRSRPGAPPEEKKRRGWGWRGKGLGGIILFKSLTIMPEREKGGRREQKTRGRGSENGDYLSSSSSIPPAADTRPITEKKKDNDLTRLGGGKKKGVTPLHLHARQAIGGRGKKREKKKQFERKGNPISSFAF